MANNQNVLYKQFKQDNLWRYKDEGSLNLAFERYLKYSNQLPLSEAEFLAEANSSKNENARIAYAVLLCLFEKKQLPPQQIYLYARHGWCINNPEAIVAYQVSGTDWKVNNCSTLISQENAILKVNKEWGFEASRISIKGMPYYDATDWQFVAFNCAGISWLWANDSLEQIWE